MKAARKALALAAKDDSPELEDDDYSRTVRFIESNDSQRPRSRSPIRGCQSPSIQVVIDNQPPARQVVERENEDRSPPRDRSESRHQPDHHSRSRSRKKHRSNSRGRSDLRDLLGPRNRSLDRSRSSSRNKRARQGGSSSRNRRKSASRHRSRQRDLNRKQSPTPPAPPASPLPVDLPDSPSYFEFLDDYLDDDLVRVEVVEEPLVQPEDKPYIPIPDPDLIAVHAHTPTPAQWDDPVLYAPPLATQAPSFPEFTPAMEQKVLEGMQGDGEFRLVDKPGITVTKQELRSLETRTWLSDGVVTAYMRLIEERNELLAPIYPSTYALHSIYIYQLMMNGYRKPRRRRVNPFSYDIILCPINVDAMHWTLAVISNKRKKIEYFDSLGGFCAKAIQALRGYLQGEYEDIYGKRMEPSWWKGRPASLCRRTVQTVVSSSAPTPSILPAAFRSASARLTWST
jgi:Ulp1 protease family, C-terminal catalytic domain